MRFGVIAAIVVAVSLGVVGVVVAQPKPADPKTVAVPADTSNEPNLKVIPDTAGVSKSRLITDAPLPSDYVMGKDSAPLIMIEYASFTCPHCSHFSNAVLPELEKKYIDTGKMRYILRHFPLNEPALKASMLAECVGETSHSKYYVFAKVMFDAQAKWAFDGNYMAGLETIANVGGISKQEFMNCVSNTDREMRVLKVKKDAGDELKIPHTPYFFIGGEVYGGEKTVPAMSQFIEAKLAQVTQQKK
ncbi:MAG: DsbA family protein [Rickettsiales bacterium]|jgi:protein-disulfide isomerase|nr:DsbA family protein [Rickettsiales bacterium]